MKLEELQAAARELPHHEPGPAQRDAMRAALLEAARASPPLRRRRSAPALAAAAAAVTLLSAAGLMLWWSDRPAGDVAAASPRATIRSSSGAHFEHTRQRVAPPTGAPAAVEEVVRLREGRVAMAVEHLATGERFRVLTADAEVEVRGTAFEVLVERDLLVEVAVTTGRVDVRPRGRPTVSLTAGERWRADTEVAGATAAAAAAAAVGAIPSPAAASTRGPIPSTGTGTGETATSRPAPIPRTSTGPTAASAPGPASSAASSPASTAASSPASSAASSPASSAASSPASSAASSPANTAASSPASSAASSPASTAASSPASSAASSPASSAASSPANAPTPAPIPTPAPFPTPPPHRTRSRAPLPASPRSADLTRTRDSAPRATRVPEPAPASPEDALASPRPVPTASETAFGHGFRALRQGNYGEAAAQFDLAVRDAPAAPLAADARYWRAVALARSGAGRGARTALADFLARHPTHARAGEASAMLGWMLLETGDPAAAALRFRAALRDPDREVRASAEKGMARIRRRSPPP